jgi:hypothetical protein
MTLYFRNCSDVYMVPRACSYSPIFLYHDRENLEVNFQKDKAVRVETTFSCKYGQVKGTILILSQIYTNFTSFFGKNINYSG